MCVRMCGFVKACAHPQAVLVKREWPEGLSCMHYMHKTVCMGRMTCGHMLYGMTFAWRAHVTWYARPKGAGWQRQDVGCWCRVGQPRGKLTGRGGLTDGLTGRGNLVGRGDHTGMSKAEEEVEDGGGPRATSAPQPPQPAPSNAGWVA